MANKAPTLGQKLSNAQHMPVLMTITSANKDPPEGFIIRDVIKMTFESTNTRVFVQQYLVNELCSTHNVFIKIRILVTIIRVLEEGHVEFKQNLRKMPQPFNEAANLRPRQQNSQSLASECGRIRDMASRILDLLFEDTPELRRKTTPSNYAESAPPSSNSSSDRITGFGNTSYTPPTQESTSNKIKKFLQLGGGQKAVQYDPSYVTMDPVPHMKTGSSSYTPQVHTPLGGIDTSDTLSGRGYVSGRPGGGWDEPTDSPPLTKREPVATNQLSESQNDSSDVMDLSVESTSTEQEKRLVDDITAPGGVKAAPPRDMLTSFVTRCRKLDCQAVVDFLRVKLDCGENQVVLRALFVVETLSRSDLPDILSHLDLVLEELTTLTQSNHTTIKTKANKILHQLSAQNAQVSQQPVAVEPKTSNQIETSSLLDIGSNQEEPPSDPGPERTPEQAELAASLFMGMSVSGEPKNRAKPVVKPSARKPVKQEKQVIHVQATNTPSYDLLGLNDSPAVEQQEVPQQAPPIFTDDPTPADDSLLVFGSDDEDFDPLKKQRSGSMKSAGSSLTASVETGQPAVAASGLLGDLAELSSTSTPPARNEQPVLSAVSALQPTLTHLLAYSQPAVNQPMNSQPMMAGAYSQPAVNQPMNSQPMMTGAYSQPAVNQPMNSQPMMAGAYSQPQPLLNQGGVLYAPVGPSYPGGMPQGQQMMYLPMGNQRMQGPPMMAGGESRPVQLAPPTASAETPTADSSFSFLGKSTKGNAFDFVQEEMRARKTK